MDSPHRASEDLANRNAALEAEIAAERQLRATLQAKYEEQEADVEKHARKIERRAQSEIRRLAGTINDLRETCFMREKELSVIVTNGGENPETQKVKEARLEMARMLDAIEGVQRQLVAAERGVTGTPDKANRSMEVHTPMAPATPETGGDISPRTRARREKAALRRAGTMSNSPGLVLNGTPVAPTSSPQVASEGAGAGAVEPATPSENAADSSTFSIMSPDSPRRRARKEAKEVKEAKAKKGFAGVVASSQAVLAARAQEQAAQEAAKNDVSARLDALLNSFFAAHDAEMDRLRGVVTTVEARAKSALEEATTRLASTHQQLRRAEATIEKLEEENTVLMQKVGALAADYMATAEKLAQVQKRDDRRSLGPEAATARTPTRSPGQPSGNTPVGARRTSDALPLSRMSQSASTPVLGQYSPAVSGGSTPRAAETRAREAAEASNLMALFTKSELPPLPISSATASQTARDALKAGVADLVAALKDAEAGSHSASSEFQELEAQLARMEREARDWRDQSFRWQHASEERAAEIQRLEVRLGEAMNGATAQGDMLHALNTQLESLSQEAESAAEVARNEALRMQRESVDWHDQQAQQWARERQALETRLATETEARAQAEQSVQRMVEQTARLRDLVGEQEKSQARAEEQMKSLMRNITNVQAQKKEEGEALRAQIAALEAQIKEEHGRGDALSQQLEGLVNEASKVAGALATEDLVWLSRSPARGGLSNSVALDSPRTAASTSTDTFGLQMTTDRPSTPVNNGPRDAPLTPITPLTAADAHMVAAPATPPSNRNDLLDVFGASPSILAAPPQQRKLPQDDARTSLFDVFGLGGEAPIATPATIASAGQTEEPIVVAPLNSGAPPPGTALPATRALDSPRLIGSPRTAHSPGGLSPRTPATSNLTVNEKLAVLAQHQMAMRAALTQRAEQNAALLEHIGNLQTTLLQREESMVNLRADAMKAAAEREVLQQTIAKLHAGVEEVKTSMAEEAESIGRERADHQARLDEMTEQYEQALRQREQSSAEEHARIGHEARTANETVAALRQQLQDVNAELHAVREGRADGEQQRANLVAERARLQQERTQYSNALAQAQEQVTELTNQLQQAEMQLSEERERVTALDNRLAVSSALAAHRESAWETKQTEVADLTHLLQESQAEAAALGSQLATAQLTIEARNTEIASVQQREKAADDQLTAVRRELEEVTARHANEVVVWRDAHASAQTEAQEWKQRAQEVTNEKETAQEAHSSLRATHEQAAAAVAQHVDEVTRLRAELASTKTELVTAQSQQQQQQQAYELERTRVQKDLEGVQAQLQNTLRDAEAARQAHTEAVAARAAVTEQLAAATAARDELQRKLTAAEADHTRGREEHDKTLKQEKATAEQRHKEALDRVHALELEKATEAGRVSTLEERARAMEERLKAADVVKLAQEQQVKLLSDRVQQLEGDKTSHAERATRLEGDKASEASRAASLEERVRQLEADKNAEKIRADAAAERVRVLEADKAAALAGSEDRVKKLEADKAAAETRAQALAERVQGLESGKATDAARITGLEERVKAVEMQKDAESVRATVLDTQREQATTRARALEEKVAQLETQNEAKTARANAVEERAKGLENQREAEASRAAVAEARATTAERNLQAAEERINAMKTEHAAQEASHGARHRTAEVEKAAAATQIAALTAERNTLQSIVHDSKAQLEEAHRRVGAAEKSSAASSPAIDELRRERDAAVAATAALREDKARAEGERAALLTVMAQTREASPALATAVPAPMTSSPIMTRTPDTANAVTVESILLLGTQLQDLKERNAALAREAEQQKAEAERQRGKRKEERKAFEQKLESLSRTQTNIDAAASLNATVHETLNEDLATAQSSADHLRRRLVNVTQERDALRARLNRVRGRLSSARGSPSPAGSATRSPLTIGKPTSPSEVAAMAEADVSVIEDDVGRQLDAITDLHNSMRIDDEEAPDPIAVTIARAPIEARRAPSTPGAAGPAAAEEEPEELAMLTSLQAELAGIKVELEAARTEVLRLQQAEQARPAPVAPQPVAPQSVAAPQSDTSAAFKAQLESEKAQHAKTIATLQDLTREHKATQAECTRLAHESQTRQLEVMRLTAAAEGAQVDEEARTHIKEAEARLERLQVQLTHERQTVEMLRGELDTVTGELRALREQVANEKARHASVRGTATSPPRSVGSGEHSDDTEHSRATAVLERQLATLQTLATNQEAQIVELRAETLARRKATEDIAHMMTAADETIAALRRQMATGREDELRKALESEIARRRDVEAELTHVRLNSSANLAESPVRTSQSRQAISPYASWDVLRAVSPPAHESALRAAERLLDETRRRLSAADANLWKAAHERTVADAESRHQIDLLTAQMQAARDEVKALREEKRALSQQMGDLERSVTMRKLRPELADVSPSVSYSSAAGLRLDDGTSMVTPPNRILLHNELVSRVEAEHREVVRAQSLLRAEQIKAASAVAEAQVAREEKLAVELELSAARATLVEKEAAWKAAQDHHAQEIKVLQAELQRVRDGREQRVGALNAEVKDDRAKLLQDLLDLENELARADVERQETKVSLRESEQQITALQGQLVTLRAEHEQALQNLALSNRLLSAAHSELAAKPNAPSRQSPLVRVGEELAREHAAEAAAWDAERSQLSQRVARLSASVAVEERRKARLEETLAERRPSPLTRDHVTPRDLYGNRRPDAYDVASPASGSPAGRLAGGIRRSPFVPASRSPFHDDATPTGHRHHHRVAFAADS